MKGRFFFSFNKFSRILMVMAVLCLVAVLLGVVLTGCAPEEAPVEDPAEEPEDEVEPEAPEKLVFGGARSLSGPLAFFDETAFGPIYRMWVEEVNDRGGIYVEEFGKQIPVELKIYDDTSDVGTMTNMLERLILEDEVDFILPPTSTAGLFAAGPLAQEYGYVLIGAEGGCSSIVDDLAEMEYFFSSLNFADHQVPALVELFVNEGLESAAIIYIDDLHGVEYEGVARPALEAAGVEIAFSTSVPMGTDDLTSQLRDAEAAGVDAFLGFVYPDEGFLAVGQSMEMGYNPDLFLLGPGPCYQVFKDDVFGPAVEGVMGWGAWNRDSTPEASDFTDRLVEYTGSESIIDWWGHLPYYAGLQCLEQAIEKAGTLDHEKIQEILNNETFDTVLGETWFERGSIAEECYAGQVGQWIEGKWEVVGPVDKATADPVVPKPEWP